MIGYEHNVAVPHIERLPCQYDDISFPAGLDSRALNFFGYNVKFKSLKFGNVYWNNEDLAHYISQKVISGKYDTMSIYFKNVVLIARDIYKALNSIGKFIRKHT